MVDVQAVTVLGDYLYIVGGGLAQKPQGNGGDQESDVHGGEFW